jgi:glycogen(starch) synthase
MNNRNTANHQGRRLDGKIRVKRILFWSGTFWPNIGGVEVHAAKLLPALRERGYEYTVIAPKTDEKLADKESYRGIPIYRFPFRNNLSDRSLDQLIVMRAKIADLKRQVAPDLVHINAVGVDNFFHLTTAEAYRAPVLVTLHGKWSMQADAVVKKTLGGADWVVGCSAAILGEGRKLVPQIISRSSVIYNGVEVPSLCPSVLPFDAPRLLCLGRLAPDKGFDIALPAFKSLLRCYPRARLIIAGNGPERERLEKQAESLGIHQAVELNGWVSPLKVAELINSVTLVVMPSREDSFPLVALEAALMGRPLVATRVGGLPEIIVPMETGILVDKEDCDGLTKAIAFLLDRPQEAMRMGEAARLRAQAIFRWERHVDAYDALYQTLITKRSASLQSSP